MKRVENSEPGVCPTCVSYEIDYGALSVSGEEAYYPVKCHDCGLEFREYYNLEFDAQYVEKAKYETD